MMIRLLIFSLAFAVQASCLAEEQTRRISNEDVVWSFGYFGVSPGIGGVSADSFQRMTTKDTSFLIKALDDEKRFAAAHIILMMLHGQKGEDDEDTYFGLSTKMQPDLRAKYDPKDREALKCYWKKRLKEEAGAPD